jgi:hypothetical protein
MPGNPDPDSPNGCSRPTTPATPPPSSKRTAPSSAPIRKKGKKKKGQGERGQFLILIHEAPKATLPAPALRANCAINAAFAKVWSVEFNEPGWCLPYVVDGSAAGGEALLGILDGFLATPSNDRRVIQAWADHLGLGHWLKWIQHSP